MPPLKKTSIRKESLARINPSGKKESFFEMVYAVARRIPKGRVTSYGAIAACLGAKLSARMVGWAMNGAHSVKPGIPAHRVVNRNGMLSGKHHFETPTRMGQYFTVCIIWWTMIEMPGIMAVIGFILTLNHAFLFLGIFHVLVLFIFMPRKHNIIMLLNLNSEEITRLEGKS